MVGLNASSVWGGILSSIAQYILGNYELLGVWLIILFIGLAFAFNLNFNLTLVLIIPIVVVAMATGMLYGVVGGVMILFVGFILGANFFFNK